MPRKPPYRPTRGPRRRGPRVTREQRDAAVAPKVRYFKPTRERIRGAIADLNIPPLWVTTPNPPDAVEGENYFYGLRQHLNTGFGVEITVTNGALPDGLSIDGLNIVGTPTVTGTFANIQLTATNTEGTDESAAFDIVISAFSWISTPTPPQGSTGVPYDYDLGQHLSSSQNVNLTTFAGTLPDGLSYAGTRIIGTPSTEENQTGIVTTADNGTASDNSAAYAIDIAFGLVQWTSTPAPTNITVGVPYSYDLTQHLNGTSGVTIGVASGVLPPGLTINNSTYVIEGTPTSFGSFRNIRLIAVGAFNSDTSGFFNMDVAPTAVSWTSTPEPDAGNQGVPYSYDLSIHLNTTDQVVVTDPGDTLPDGLTITSGWFITGTPTTLGNVFPVQLTATNPGGSDVSGAFSINIVEGVVIWESTPNPPSAVENQAYVGYDLEQDLNHAVNVTVTDPGNTLPAGLSIVGNSIEGTPTQSGNFSGIRSTATSPFNAVQSSAYSLEVLDAPPLAPVWTTDPPILPDATVGVPYLYDFTGDLNTVEGVVITQTGIGTLPTGIDIVGVTLQGTPTSEGESDNLQFTATNVSGSAESQVTVLDVNAPAPVWVTQPNAPDGTLNVGYSYDLGANLSTTAEVTILVEQGNLPQGLSINPTTLVLEGTPTTIETQTGIVYRAGNESGFSDSDPDSIQIFPIAPLWTSTPAPPLGTVGVVYPPYDLAQHLNTTDGVIVTVTAGSLPPGLTINNVTYVIEGTPTLDGNYTGIQLTAQNTAGSSESQPFDMQIAISVNVDARLDNPTQNTKQVFDKGFEFTSPPDVGAEQDYQNRINGPGVVWHHNFNSQAEVDQFRWKGGLGNDPNDNGTPGTVNWISDDGVTGNGCLEVLRRAGQTEGAVWWRMFSPLDGASNGRGVDDPGDGGRLPPQSFSPTQGGGQTQFWTNNAPRPGYYGHNSYHGGPTPFDGTEYFLQTRVKMDPRRMTGGNESNAFYGGKISYLTLTGKSLTGQEIVMNSHGGGNQPAGGPNFSRSYTSGSPSLDQQDSYGRPGHQVGNDNNDYVAGDYCHVVNNVNKCWSFSEGWDTIMWHIIPGRNGVEETRVIIYAANPGDTKYTKIQDNIIDLTFEELWEPGWNALICSGYNNNFNLPQDFWYRFDEIILSKQFIPLPQSTPSWWEDDATFPELTWQEIAGGAGFGDTWQNGETINDNPTTPVVGGKDNVTDAWGMAQISQWRNEMTLWANGGHFDYSGNECYTLDLRDETPRWRLQVQISASRDGGANADHPTGGYADGTMRSCHHWQAGPLWADGDLWCPYVAGMYETGFDTYVPWRMNRERFGAQPEPIPNQQSYQEHYNQLRSVFGGNLLNNGQKSAYNSYSRRMYTAAQAGNDGGSGLWSFNIDDPNGTFVEHPCFHGGSGTGGWMVYVENDTHRILVHGTSGNQLLSVADVSNDNPTSFPSVSYSGVPALTLARPAVHYHREANALYMWNQTLGTTVYKCVIPADPFNDTWVWTAVNTAGGAVPRVPGGYIGVWHKCNLVHNMGDGRAALVFVADNDEPTYILKIPKGGL